MEQERPLKERLWEFTKDFSAKAAKKAEKHWKINTLRVEIASLRHRIGIKHRELGALVYKSHRGTLEEGVVFESAQEDILNTLKGIEEDIKSRQERIEMLEQEIGESYGDMPPPPPSPTSEAQEAQPEAEAAAADDDGDDSFTLEKKEPASEEKSSLDESEAAKETDKTGEN